MRMFLLLFLLEMLQTYKLLPRAVILTLSLKPVKPLSKPSSCCMSSLQIPIYSVDYNTIAPSETTHAYGAIIKAALSASLKTRNARRTVYMSDKLKAYFSLLLQQQQRDAAELAAQRAQNQTFITGIDGKKISSLELANSLPNGKIQTVNSMKYHSRTIKSELGIDFKYHHLRHTYGTRLAEMNTPTHILCNQMGHASGKVTERYYLAVSKPGIDVLTSNLNAM